MEKVRIFISSPSDVATERSIAQQVVTRLQEEYSDRLELSALFWEHEPLLASSDFQSQISSAVKFEIFVTILWGRIGSPLGGNFVRDDGTPYLSGTEYEFEEALAGFQATGKPRLLVYRKTADAPHLSDSEGVSSQLQKVEEFFTKWFVNRDDSTAKAAYHKFVESAEFEEKFEIHLRKLLQFYLLQANNLPTHSTPFIGREELISRVCEQIKQDDIRLITLVGPGGAGKSRASLEVGRELLSTFDDGVFMIPLATLNDPGQIPETIATTLGVRAEGGSIMDGVVASLKHKEMLLIVDNLEQVQSGSTHLSTILKACPKVKILVTSREVLRLDGARTVQVPPFKLPDTGRLPPIDELAKVESIALFVARAKAVREGFELSMGNALDIVEICRRVDALPLAIELAASRIRSMNPDRLLKGLDQRFKVLTGGADDLLDHQKSLRDLIAWSYDLLKKEDQKLWCRLAIFPDGCTIEAAQEVCDPDDDFMLEIDVQSLIDRSLVNISLDNPSSSSETEPRLSMLESLREFAVEKLKDEGSWETYQERFSSWCVDLAEHASLRGRDIEKSLTRLDAEYQNITALLEQSLSNREAGNEHGLQLCGALWKYWYTRGYFSVGRKWLDKATEGYTSEPSLLWGKVIQGKGVIARVQNRPDEATHYSTLALDLYRHINDIEGQAGALGELGVTAQALGDLDKAATYLDESIELARQLDNPHSFSFSLNARGVVHHLKGNLESAKALYEEALAAGKKGDDRAEQATALVNLGEIAAAEDNVDKAYGYYRESLELYGSLGLKLAIAYCIEIIAGLETQRGRPSKAAMLFGMADFIREELDAPIEGYNQDRMANDLQQTRNALVNEEFEANWQFGRGLTIDSLLSYVLGK